MNVVNVIPMSTSSFPPPASGAAHIPVLQREVVAAMAPRADGTYVDATLGAGGHARALLSADAGRLIGLDRDDVAIELATARLERFGDKATIVRAPFGDLDRVLDELDVDRVDGILADLGVSSLQLDEPDRGMSFRGKGPLDMRMDRRDGETALELIERLDDDELTELIGKLGEERRARRVARCIKQALEAGELESTHDLRRAIVKAVGPARQGGVDPATRTFQALRIAVNDELGQLARLIELAAERLVSGGVLALITFHSLEDRLVKRTLKASPHVWSLSSHKPILPSEEEIDDNPRARSAKLRVARRGERAD